MCTGSTDRQTAWQTDRRMEETYGPTERQRYRQADRQTDRNTKTQTGRQADKRQTDRQIGSRQTDRSTDIQTDRQTRRHCKKNKEKIRGGENRRSFDRQEDVCTCGNVHCSKLSLTVCEKYLKKQHKPASKYIRFSGFQGNMHCY
jgi:hypothetical protein